ncbi:MULTISPECIES: phage tail tape measure protein [unclassified Aurantimonas]|uniref:phage tail tape measure protein n=1 Tax=unclassified Aurantimonas TaxID=2638230 RepID=UPI002E19688B|nr:MULTISPECIES: phage tail tape measure protein [unclassified Aurantimonas]MEC5289374.1 phage tail tape measure protein [Aurantimonas sp. C2-3-R2]MEC5410454.1 phage tail tape measure protein [Aurantimonas sp. C2-4-R8]
MIIDELVAVLRYDTRGQAELAKFNRGLSQTERGMQSFAANAGKFAAAASAAIAAAFVGLSASMGKAAIDFEDQMTGIQKKAGASAEQMAKVRDEILTLAGSGEIASPIEEISSAFERGAAAGLPLDDLREFALLSTKAADAFEMSAAQVGDSFAGFEKVLGVPRAELEKVADLINHLADSGIADESEIVRFMDRSGAMAKTLGLTVQETAAFGAALANLKVPAGMASTAMNAIMTKLVAPDALSAKASGAMQDLVGDVEAFARALDDDADKAIVGLLGQLKALDNAKRAGIIANIFGLEHVDVVSQMVEGLDEVKRNLHDAGDESLWLGSLQRSYNLKLDDTSSKFRIFWNNMKGWLISIGDRALPILNRALDRVSEFMFRMRSEGFLGKVADGFEGVWLAAEHLAIQAFRVGRGFYYASDAVVGLTSRITGLSKGWAALGMGAGVLASSAMGRGAMMAIARRVPFVAAALALDDIMSGLNGDDSLIGSTVEGQASLDNLKAKFAELGESATSFADSLGVVRKAIVTSFNMPPDAFSSIEDIKTRWATLRDEFGGTWHLGELEIDASPAFARVEQWATEATERFRLLFTDPIGLMMNLVVDAINRVASGISKIAYALNVLASPMESVNSALDWLDDQTGNTTQRQSERRQELLRPAPTSGGRTGKVSGGKSGRVTDGVGDRIASAFTVTEEMVTTTKAVLDITGFMAPATQAMAIQADLARGVNAVATLNIDQFMANADRAQARLNALRTAGGQAAAVATRPQVAQSAAAP